MANRIFIATELFQPLIAVMQDLQGEWRQRMQGTYVRWVRFDCMHLTFHFLGDVPGTQVASLSTLLPKTLSGLSPEPVVLSNLEAFPTARQATVLMCRIEDSSGKLLQQIYDRVAAMLVRQGIRIKQRAWHPHLTLGRLPVPAVVDTSWYQPGPLAWFVSSVSLMSSTLGPGGPTYHTIKVVPLEK